MKLSSRVRRGILLGLLLFLSACVPIPDRVGFLTDGRVLRGVYEGTGTTESVEIPANARTLRLRLEVAPDYVDPNTYSLTGTVTVGDEAPVPFEGEVSGGDTQVYVLTSPIETPTFEVLFDYKGEKWRLYGGYWGEDRSGRRVPWSVAFGPAPDAYDFAVYQASLVPVE